jgi:Na+-transporting NADH:ubiquinone oxidoreductase subunit A
VTIIEEDLQRLTMSQTIKLKKGFDINLIGKADKKIVDITQPETFALKPTDFKGISRPKVMVEEGDNVKAGTPVMFDKAQPDIMFCAPVSGEIVEIKRGEKRKLLEIKILADKQIEYIEHKKCSVSDIANMNRDELADHMKKSGVWPFVIQRPFGIVADSDAEPKAIFISGFDSHPLAPDLAFLLEGDDQYFQAGIDVLKKFTQGNIHLNISSDAEVPHLYAHTKGVQLNNFPMVATATGSTVQTISPLLIGSR